MNEYNERILKNVLQDIREENDAELLKEIEEAANNPLYQNKEGEAAAFAEKYCKPSKKKSKKIFFRAASVLLVLVLGLSVIPVTVEGHRSTIIQLIANFVNSEFIAVDNEDKLLSYEGKYIPSWIPEGYKVESVTNTKDKKEIVFVNSDKNMINYNELSSGAELNIDGENTENININGYEGIFTKKDGVDRIVITIEDVILYITCDDPEIDLIGFAELIEKR